MRTVGVAIGKHFALTNIGRVRLNDWLLARDDAVPGLLGPSETGDVHHMGTARMGDSPRKAWSTGLPDVHGAQPLPGRIERLSDRRLCQSPPSRSSSWPFGWLSTC